MRYPYDLFIRFLVTRKADVNETLRRLSLPPLTDTEIFDKDITGGPEPAPEVSEPALFIAWAESQDIRELWELQNEFKFTEHRKLTHGSDAMARAFDLFADPEKRTALSLMLIRSFDPDDIANTFADHLNFPVTSEVVQLFSKFFGNFDELSKRDWNHLLKNLHPQQRDSLRLGIDAESQEFVSYSVGRLPRLTYEEILHDIMVSSYYKFKALVDQPLMDFLAQRWAALAITSGEKKARYTKGDRTDIVEDIQLRFEFQDDHHPTLSDLVTNKLPTGKS